MRMKIMAGIVGTVACTALAIGTASPAAAAAEPAAVEPAAAPAPTDVVGDLLRGLIQAPQGLCIACW